MEIKINRELNAEQLKTLYDFVNNEETTDRQHWSEYFAEDKDKKTIYIDIDNLLLKCRFNYADKDGRIVSIEIEDK